MSGFKEILKNSRLIIMGIGLAAIFLIVEAWVNAFILHRGAFIDVILIKNPHEIVLNIVIISLFAVLGIYAQSSLKKRTYLDDALKQSFQRYENLFENVNNVVFIMSMDGTVTSLNRAFETVTGWKRKDWIGRYFAGIVHPDDLPLATDKFQQVLSEKTPGIFELRIISKSGEYLTGEFMTSPQMKQDRVIGILGIARDITERKKAEKTIQRQAQILNQIQDSVVTTDLDGFVTGWNRGAERMFSYAAEEAIERHVSFIYPEDQHEFLQKEIIAPLKEKGEYESEVRLKRKSGEEFYAFLLLTLLKDENGSVIGMIGSSRDITKRKKVEEELAFKNSILSTQQEVSIDGILVVDEAGTIISFNHRFVDMWGIPSDVIESRSDERALRSVLDKLADPEQFLDKVGYLYGHINETSRDEIILKDGSTFDRYSAPMFGPDGRYYGRVWYFRDVTERKKTEEEREKLIVDLKEALATVKTLSGLLPICAWCKKIRDDRGYWKQIEDYVSEHSDALFSHGICPECMKKVYPEYYDDKDEEK